MNLKLLNIPLLLLLTFQAKAKNVPQYFIKISSGQELVKYGKLDIGLLVTKLDYVSSIDKPDEVDSKKALKWINDNINKGNDSKVLFFIHGFWGSLPLSLHRTSRVFKNDYFKTDSSHVKAIIHIIWDASGIRYKQSITSINESHKTLSVLLNNIEEIIDNEKSLMCHSMGNRFLHKTISKNKIDTKFSELIMMAPDLDYRKFEKDLHLFSSLADSVYVFYHEKDLTLNMSKSINDIERLGRISKYTNNSNINFVDCTNIEDIDSFVDTFNNHLYFITSKSVISEVEEILCKHKSSLKNKHQRQ